MKYKMETMKRCLDSIREPFTFGRPSCIVLPRKGSIASIQHNVQRTRMAHGRSLKKKDKMEEDKAPQPKPTMNRPPTSWCHLQNGRKLFFLEFRRLFVISVSHEV